MKSCRAAKRRIEVSVGESVRIIRGLQGLSQNDLAKVTRIPRTSISAIENDRMPLGIERANVLARALKCHPAALKQVDEHRLVKHREVEAWVRGLRAAPKPGSGGRRSS
jgi:transcriptional regulator with XRE-family HTH domain